MFPLGDTPTTQHFISAGSDGQAPLLYEPPSELQVEVLMQIPSVPQFPVASPPVHRPLSVATEATAANGTRATMDEKRIVIDADVASA